MDLDLRKLRYFAALAEHLNFGRAAAELHIAQSALSRQIRALESDLGAQLFVRDKRHVELTRAGEQLLADSTPMLANAEAVRRGVEVAARGTHTFTVGFMPGIVVTPAVTALEAAHPGLIVEVVRTGWSHQVQMLHDGRVDVSYVRMPVDHRGLRIVPLAAEPRVAVVAKTHRLAGKCEVGIADFVNDHLLQNPDAVPEWRDIAADSGDRGPRARQEESYSIEEKLEHVAAGRGIAILPASVATYYRRADVSTLRVADIGPSKICLAWDAARRTKLIRTYVSIALDAPSPVA